MSHRIDALAHGNRLRHLPPGQKAAFAATLLLLALVAPAPVQVLIGLWLALWVVGYAGIPAGTYLLMLLLPLGFAVSSLPAIVISAVGQDGLAGLQELAGQATHLFYRTAEAREGRDAFLEKRPADFSDAPWLP